MVVQLNIPDDKWEFLKPILEPFQITERQYELETMPIDWRDIGDLDGGVRILNVLRNMMDINTMAQLLDVDKMTFCKQRNAGKKSWETLEKYQQQIKQKIENGERI